ncbi:MAG TPA: CD225/dispanin family protein [Actinocatenispora sp.]
MYQQPYSGAPQQPPTEINDHQGWAIGAIFLFWPLAIPALMASSRCRQALAAGDFATAQMESENAHKWAKLATIIGICWYGVCILISCISGCGAMMAAKDASDSLNSGGY